MARLTTVNAKRLHRRGLGLAVALTGALIVVAPPAGAADLTRAAAGRPSPAQARDFAGRVELPGGRRLYLECRGHGRPTVILVSGYPNRGDVWSQLDLGVRGPPVLAGVARYSRVCAYDRPNTVTPTGNSLALSRSDPVPQPRTGAALVAELHALLRAARLPGPYVLVGHSLGGLIARLYASTYPRQVAGLVPVDATYERLRELFSPEQWAAVARTTLEPSFGVEPPVELVDLDASVDEMLAAKAARPLRPTLPLVVLSAGLPPAVPDQGLPPGFPDAATLNRVQRVAQNELGMILPYARHVIAKKSGHYIQTAQPELVIDAVRRILRMVRPATVRCRAGADFCRASVSLAGGASNKQVVIRLSHSDLRLVSVRPNRRTLRDAYGLLGQRLRAGGTKYTFRLNAAQSIRRGAYLTITFGRPPADTAAVARPVQVSTVASVRSVMYDLACRPPREGRRSRQSARGRTPPRPAPQTGRDLTPTEAL
jgi:pimeloyl-ACP methyl ester carboxylesterase